jgi:iron complex transport system ATP-binding protein
MATFTTTRRTPWQNPAPAPLWPPAPQATLQPPSTAADAAVLQVLGATARLPGHRVGPVHLALRAGEQVALLGPSGAGKSTLVRLLAGERPCSAGEVRLAGRALPLWATLDLARARAVLPQQHGVAFGLPVELVVGLGRLGREHETGHAALVAQALEAAHASHLLGRRVDTLSGGEMARVQLARVMAQLWDAPPGLLLVDEPLAALDPALQLDLLDHLQQYARQRGHALVAVLHDINQALSGFQRLWLLKDGQLQHDLPADAQALPALSALFGITLDSWTAPDGGLRVAARRRSALANAA